MKLAPIRKFALSLPDTTEEPHFNYSSFRVKGKIFVTIPPEETHIHVFVGDDEREKAIELHSDYIEKLWWGKKVLGVRVTLAKAELRVVKEMVKKAYERKATSKG